MSLFHGLSTFPITPDDEQVHVDTNALATLLPRLAVAKLDSIGCSAAPLVPLRGHA